MPKFSARSIAELNTCHSDLILIFREVIKHYDCTVIQGHRGEEEQNEYFRTGRSKLKFPESKHNKFPSHAVDVAPYILGLGIPWSSRKEFDHFGGFVRGVAAMKNIDIRWGGDWSQNKYLGDNTFNDLVHFELVL